MNKDKYRELVDSIMDCFNFERVHEVMVCLNWTWGEGGVPEVYELRKSARDRLLSLYDENISYSESGGFAASKEVDEDGTCYVDLKFIVEQWDEEGNCNG